MPPPSAAPEWHGTKTGWLYNYHVTTLMPAAPGGGGAGGGAADAGPGGEVDDVVKASGESALRLFFIDLDGETFECPLKYTPYFFVAATEGHEREVELGITGAFGAQLESVTVVEKEDLGMVNHLSGKRRKFIKLVFANTNDLTAVRSTIEKAIQRNKAQDGTSAGGGFAGAELDFRGTMATVPIDAAAPGGAMRGHGGDDVLVADGGMSKQATEQSKMSWMRYIEDMREYDVKYFVRVAIDLDVFVGLWYDITNEHGAVSLEQCDTSKYTNAIPRICAFDIETTKAPLKFPQPETDQIYMISYMIDGKGYLIVNREIVTEDIEPFEYTPRPEYEGHFECFNEVDEQATLRRFYDEMKTQKPLVYVTYNGDYFDFPFIQARSEFYGMSLRQELGYAMSSEGATLNPRLPHLDCFYWVKRDSYLPQGSQGLKAVTKAKLGFEPIEVDPEDMLPLARERPQMMASYSVSDAVSTYYLYMKYVHPFIYSLCTIIPMAPDDVLRKGSGTLCESLLCVQAYKKNVIWPNKQVSVLENFHEGHLIDSETYIGGRVEALQSGVYRSDVPIRFKCVPDALQKLSDELDEQLKFTIEVENGCKMEEITNYEEVRDAIRAKLLSLRDSPDRMETPMIYHLDVGAMYPNIILTNRLQPPAMVTQETCAGCCYNTPDNAHKCKRSMHWKWKGEMFTAGRHEFHRIKAQLESEGFAAAAVEKADAAAMTKKTYGNKRGNVLEGTTFEKKDEGFGGKKKGGPGAAGGGYRKQSAAQGREAQEALLDSDDDADGGDEGGDGTTRFHQLKDNTQFALLKKRMAEYSRKAYRSVHDTKEVLKTATVCQREDSFYVDTVRLFRDRRYHYKRELKRWKGIQDKATEPSELKEAKGRVVQMESLQLAHKCILNSFYGYVMRKGSRWYSMEMAGVVTYLGAGLIMIARQLVQQIGVTLELDTDGIWCCLPSSFPEDFTFTTSNPKKQKFDISYPCVVLNKDVQDRHTNHQYQDAVDGEVGNYNLHSECSIYFEVDGPYKSMILPASREQGKGIKKRYAVFHPDGRLAELKGFELKRRGELMLIKDFQSQVFRRFLDGNSLAEAYASAAKPANDALDLLYSQGEGYDDEEILAKLVESSNMTRRLSEYPESQKSLALTTARRIGDFLGPQMVKDKGLACVFIIAKRPQGKPVTERPIPLNVFKAEPQVRAHYLRHWTGDHTITPDTSIRDILDWDYYIARFSSCVQKIISIPAALQHVANPVPRVEHPDWLKKVVAERSSKHRQITLFDMASRGWGAGGKAQQQQRAIAAMRDMEDIGGKDEPKPAAIGGGTRRARAAAEAGRDADSVERFLDELSDADDVDVRGDDVASDAAIDCNDDDDDLVQADEAEAEKRDLEAIRKAEEEAALAKERETRANVEAFKSTHLQKTSAAVDASFFQHAGYQPWLKETRAKWLDRVRLRRKLFDGDAGGGGAASARAVDAAAAAKRGGNTASAGFTVTSNFVDRKARAMAGAWHVLEVRDAPDSHCPAGVDVLALVDGQAISARVQVKRTILVETATADCIDTLFGADAIHVRPVRGQKTLPRHHQAANLFEVDVSSMRDGGATVIDRLKHREESVIRVYEDFITPSDTLIKQMGAVCSVDAQVHLARCARDSAAAAAASGPSSSRTARTYTAPREAFLSSELATHTTATYLSGALGESGRLRHVFVFHAAVPESDTRMIIGAFFPATGEVTAAVVQPSAAARPNINMKNYVADAAKLVGVDAATVPIANVRIEYVNEARAAFRIVDGAIDDSLHGPAATRVQIAVIQSAMSTPGLLKSNALPSLASLAALRTVGSAEDDRIITTNPLTWVRDVARRSVQRYAASGLWLEERRVVAATVSVPLCSLKQDVYLSAWDTLFARALHRRGHVLWNGASESDRADDDTAAENSGATQTACPGGHLTWSVELGIGQVDIVAAIFSQTVQEGDDPSMLALNDKGIGTHFAVLRDVVSNLYGRALQQDHGAGAVLVNFSRWLKCPACMTHDPSIVAHIGALVTRLLAAFLIRITKLGGRIVRADTRSVIIGSNRTSLSGSMQFADYVLSSLLDNAVLRHLAPTLVRYWPSIVIVDRDDYVGLALEAPQLAELQAQKAASSDDGSAELAVDDHIPALQLRSRLDLAADYSPALARQLLAHLSSALLGIEQIKVTTEDALNEDASVTLATRFDRFLDVMLSAVDKWLEKNFQPSVIREVSDMVDGELGDPKDDNSVLALQPRLGAETAMSEVGRRISQLPANIRVAVRYCKDVCHVLGLLPRCESVIRKARNNCLRLCNIGPFAPEAAWEKLSQGEMRLATSCYFCNDQTEINLTLPPADWRCGSCGSLFDASAVEAVLVRRVRRLFLDDLHGDRICPKCRQVAPTVLVAVCSCGAPLKPKAEPPVARVRQLHAVAQAHDLAHLQEVTEYVLRAFGISV